ncbi:putative sugar transporter STL1 [Amylocarpus encephaloides]|uniref:Sugar transporter STL1 n=1 Tax=Amylocarpus encephaloides TaxID=45428 RepID=A0A9P7YN30_9HELO|nr:putative sugar transporter STL1 [Amylocarpus encephaloides]
MVAFSVGCLAQAPMQWDAVAITFLFYYYAVFGCTWGMCFGFTKPKSTPWPCILFYMSKPRVQRTSIQPLTKIQSSPRSILCSFPSSTARPQEAMDAKLRRVTAADKKVEAAKTHTEHLEEREI